MYITELITLRFNLTSKGCDGRKRIDRTVLLPPPLWFPRTVQSRSKVLYTPYRYDASCDGNFVVNESCFSFVVYLQLVYSKKGWNNHISLTTLFSKRGDRTLDIDWACIHILSKHYDRVRGPRAGVCLPFVSVASLPFPSVGPAHDQLDTQGAAARRRERRREREPKMEMVVVVGTSFSLAKKRGR